MDDDLDDADGALGLSSVRQGIHSKGLSNSRRKLRQVFGAYAGAGHDDGRDVRRMKTELASPEMKNTRNLLKSRLQSYVVSGIKPVTLKAVFVVEVR